VLRSLKLGLGLGCGLVLAQPVFAAPITRDINTPSAGLSHTNDFGNVVLTQVTASEVLVTVNLASGVAGFHTQGSSDVFGFSIKGNPTVTINGFSNAAFSAGTTNVDTGATFGTFGYTINCAAKDCNGGAKTQTGPLSFDVSVTSGGLSITQFSSTSGDYFYFADILGGSGTPNGLVAAFAEPSTLMLFATPLTGLFFLRRKTLRAVRISGRC